MKKEDRAYSQEPYRIRIHWGNLGAEQAAEEGAIVVVIDTLDFSTAVITALSRGATIIPAPDENAARRIADEEGAHLARDKKIAREKGGFSLSSSTMEKASHGDKIVLPSTNGALDASLAKKANSVLVGSLTNARAIARVIRDLLCKSPVICALNPCGERWPHQLEFRPTIEDYLSASVIIHEIGLHDFLSPEAVVCEAAWRQLESQYRELISDSGSARKIIEEGFPEDVQYACRLNEFDVVPILIDGEFRDFDLSLSTAKAA